MTVQSQPGEGDVALLLEDQSGEEPSKRQTLLLLLDNQVISGAQNNPEISQRNLLEEDGGVQEYEETEGIVETVEESENNV